MKTFWTGLILGLLAVAAFAFSGLADSKPTKGWVSSGAPNTRGAKSKTKSPEPEASPSPDPSAEPSAKPASE